MRRGFSLVELSIVLVILGLLVGGILAGQSLIRASELRAVGAEYSRWQTAAHAFRDKYFAIPGDMANATAFWGRQASTADCTTNSSASVNANGACDGDGTGSVLWDNSGAVGTAREMHQFWRQLALAGLIEGTYSGVAGPLTNSADVMMGVNAPRSKLSGAGWGMAGGNNCGISANCFYPGSGLYRNYYIIGRPATAGGNTPINPVMTPAEAWNLDTKLDDGLPASGTIIPRWSAANVCTTASSNTDGTGVYNVGSSNLYCALFFVKIF